MIQEYFIGGGVLLSVVIEMKVIPKRNPTNPERGSPQTRSRPCHCWPGPFGARVLLGTSFVFLSAVPRRGLRERHRSHMPENTGRPCRIFATRWIPIHAAIRDCWTGSNCSCSRPKGCSCPICCSCCRSIAVSSEAVFLAGFRRS